MKIGEQMFTCFFVLVCYNRNESEGVIMKKLGLLCLLLVVVSGCGSKEKSVTCKMETNATEAGAQVKYIYNDKKAVIKIENESFLQFSEEELKDVSLDEYYKEYEKLYKEAKKASGVDITLSKEEKKNRINMKTVVDVETYDMNDDVLSLASEGNLENIEDVVALKEALGYYQCGSIK